MDASARSGSGVGPLETAFSQLYLQVQADASIIATRGSHILDTLPLWPGGAPEWFGGFWNLLRQSLPSSDNWNAWFDWYTVIVYGGGLWSNIDLATRESLEVDICLIPADWDRGVGFYNFQVAELIDKASRASIGTQGPGPHFGLNKENRAAPFPHYEYDTAGNIPQRLHSQLPLVRRAVQDLVATVPRNEFPALLRESQNYSAAVEAEPERIDWGVLFGLGVYLEEAAAAAKRRIAESLTPPLEDRAETALNTLLRLHPLLINASGEGRALIQKADALALTRVQQEQIRQDALALARALGKAKEVAEAATAKDVERAAEAIANGPHAERGTQYGLATIANLSVVLISAATAHALGESVGGTEGFAIQWAALESLKKTPMFANALEGLGEGYRELLKSSGETIYWKLAALAPFRKFVLQVEPHLRAIAAYSSWTRWALHYIDFIKNTDGSHLI